MRWIAAAFVVLAVVGGYAIDRRAHQEAKRNQTAQRAACERTNVLRRQINQQNTAFLLHNEVTRDTFASDPNSPALRRASHLYEEITAAYLVLPTTDCRQAVDDPEGYEPAKLRRPTKRELDRAYERFFRNHKEHAR